MIETFTINKKYSGNIFRSLIWRYRLRNLKVISLPNTWNDLTEFQLCLVAKILFTTTSVNDAINFLFLKFTKLNFFEMLFLKIEDLYTILTPPLKFIMEPISIDNTLIPFIATPMGNMYGPQSNFIGLSWQQFALAETCINEFDTTQKENLLDSLIAILYCTPQHPTWEKWSIGMGAEFQTKLEKNYKQLSIDKKQAIYLNYFGIKRKLIESEMFPNLYPIKSAPTSNTKQSDNIDWHAISINLAGGKFGTLEELYTTPCFDVLKHIDMEIKYKKEND